jgi:hypothetical protein
VANSTDGIRGDGLESRHAEDRPVPGLDARPSRMMAEPTKTSRGAPARRRGRPLEMAPAVLLERIQRLAQRAEGLFRVHRTHRGLYARARRQFGSWAAAVRAAGLDYGLAVRRAQRRSIENRRRRLTTGRRARLEGRAQDD